MGEYMPTPSSPRQTFSPTTERTECDDAADKRFHVVIHLLSYRVFICVLLSDVYSSAVLT